MKNKIVLIAECNLVDAELREWVSKLNTKLDTLNERTKQHTRDIQELRRKIK